MARGKKHTAAQVVNLLRQVEVAVMNGQDDATSMQRSRDRGVNVSNGTGSARAGNNS